MPQISVQNTNIATESIYIIEARLNIILHILKQIKTNLIGLI